MTPKMRFGISLTDLARGDRHLALVAFRKQKQIRPGSIDNSMPKELKEIPKKQKEA